MNPPCPMSCMIDKYFFSSSGNHSKYLSLLLDFPLLNGLCVCVCVSVSEKERENEYAFLTPAFLKLLTSQKSGRRACGK